MKVNILQWLNNVILYYIEFPYVTSSAFVRAQYVYGDLETVIKTEVGRACLLYTSRCV